MSKTVAYLRVSTDQQELERQQYLIEKSGITVDKVYSEKISGGLTLEERPELTKALEELNEGDTLLIESLSRLSRITLISLALLQDFVVKGIKVKSLSGDVGDLSTPEGWFTTTVMCASQQLERDLTRKRTKDALRAKKQKGEKLGRPIITENIEKALDLFDKGVPAKDICFELGIKLSTLYYHLRNRK